MFVCVLCHRKRVEINIDPELEVWAAGGSDAMDVASHLHHATHHPPPPVCHKQHSTHRFDDAFIILDVCTDDGGLQNEKLWI